MLDQYMNNMYLVDKQTVYVLIMIQQINMFLCFKANNKNLKYDK